MAMQGLREDTRGRERRDRAGKKMLAKENRGLKQAVSGRLTRRVWMELRGGTGRE